MTYADMKDNGGQVASRPDAESRSTFQDRALILFYATSVVTAMAGWLWFLGLLTRKLIALLL
jgi:hypothetical protein